MNTRNGEHKVILALAKKEADYFREFPRDYYLTITKQSRWDGYHYMAIRRLAEEGKWDDKMHYIEYEVDTAVRENV